MYNNFLPATYTQQQIGGASSPGQKFSLCAANCQQFAPVMADGSHGGPTQQCLSACADEAYPPAAAQREAGPQYRQYYSHVEPLASPCPPVTRRDAVRFV